MTSKEIVIDFETLDYGLREDLGPGWAWGGVKVLGMSWVDLNGASQAQYETNVDNMVKILLEADVIIAHNAQYEAGILYYLGVDVKQVTIYCTKIAGLFVKSNRFNNTLNGLAKEVLGESKLSTEMLDTAIERGLVNPQKSYYAENQDTQTAKNARKRANNEMWDNLDRLQEVDEVVAKYANVDVELTKALYLKFRDQLNKKKLWDRFHRFSLLIQVTTLMRAKGIRVDIRKTYDAKNILQGQTLMILNGLFL